MEGCVPKCEVQDEHDVDARLRDFIETYRSLPELWDPSNPYYTRKLERNAALDRLVAIYSNIKPKADRCDVRRKINTLRSNYRKDFRRVEASLATGKPYQPNSWVFHALSSFLPKSALKQDDDFNDTQPEDTKAPALKRIIVVKTESLAPHSPKSPNAETPQSIKSPQPPQFQSIQWSQPQQEKSPQLSSIPSPQVQNESSVNQPGPSRKVMRLGDPFIKQNELLTLACKLLEKNEATNEFPSIVKVWGEKFMALDSQQKMFAEKAINDVLFEASLGNLDRNSVKINQDPTR